MKAICLLIALSGLASAGPGEVALAFLDSVRERTVDLAPGKGTAISAHTSPAKVEQIAGRLKRMVHDLGSRPLQLGEVRVDGDLAGAMVWKADGYAPSHMQVFAVALVNRDGRWLPAPVPGSFENCDAGFDPSTRMRTESLRNWMLRQQVADLAQLRSQCIERMRQRIEGHITREQLKQLDADRLLERFLKACSTRNEYAILGLIGGLADDLPDNWAQRAMSVELAANATGPINPWHLLMNDRVLRAVVEHEKDRYGAVSSIACLDAEIAPLFDDGQPRVQLIHLTLTRLKSGLWQVNPPDSFWQADFDAIDDADPKLDSDLLQAFPRAIRTQHPARPLESALLTRDALITTLNTGRFADLMPLLASGDDPQQELEPLLHAARLWSSIHGLPSERNPPSAHLLLPLSIRVTGQAAAASCQRFSARRPDRYAPITLFLVKSEGGWLWQADPSNETTESFAGMLEEDWQQWQTMWRDRMVSDCPVIESMPGAPAPSVEECRRLMDAWLKAAESGNVQAALGHCARLDISDSPVMLLRNLGYELVSHLRKLESPRVMNIHRHGVWAAAGTRIDSGREASYPFYPIVATPDGPRILLEVDLIASGGRGREFLNRTSLSRLGNFNQQAGKELREMFLRHQQDCLPEKPH